MALGWSLLLLAPVLGVVSASVVQRSQATLAVPPQSAIAPNVSVELFNDLEELSRVVDIAYCVGATGTGIKKPFLCASRCQDFEGFELVTTWSTGQLMSDSCGYVALSHPPNPPRILVAFRGTYSIANTIIDLSTIPQEYVPYPGDEEEGKWELPDLKKRGIDPVKAECTNCTVHAGFMTSWRHTRPQIISHLEEAVQKYPGYRVSLVGHSLGGAVAALASLDFHTRGWNPQVTTFGEPRIGNHGLAQYLDKIFSVDSVDAMSGAYRRVTHVDDPVPLLPLTEWGYEMHTGEIYISKPDLPPDLQDLRHCNGDADLNCIAGAEKGQAIPQVPNVGKEIDMEGFTDWWKRSRGFLSVSPRYRIWQLFFAHRDYFWRLGLCIPSGDPKN